MSTSPTLMNVTSEETMEEVNTTASTPHLQQSTTAPGNETLCLPRNSSMAFDPYGSDLQDPCLPPEFGSAFSPFNLITNCVLAAVCIVSFILCAFFLRALKNAKGKITSRWCLAHVIVMDIALGVMQAYGAILCIITEIFGLYNLTVRCAFSVSHLLLNYWTGLPSLLSLLMLALDQFLAIAFPMLTHVKARDRLKKTVFSLLIWVPSTIFCAVFAGIWLASEERTCLSLLSILMSGASSFGTTGVACLSLNVVVYGALLVKVILFKHCNSLRKSDREEAQNKQRSLVFVFSAIFVANSIFWLPPWLFKAFAEACTSSDKDCFFRSRSIYLILMTFYQLNSIFDPLFLAWRFPVIGRQLLLVCRRKKERSVKTNAWKTNIKAIIKNREHTED